jgi:hypothetical protein
MATLSDLISRRFTPESKPRKKPAVQILTAPIPLKIKKAATKYEDEVFNFLLANKDSLGIKSVIRFFNLRVDGAIDLLDNRRLTFEVKYRMNWGKACIAEFQFKYFLNTDEAKAKPVSGGLVFFEEFTGDWQRKDGGRCLENGWIDWYAEHFEVCDKRLDLLRFRNQTLETVDDAMHAAGRSDKALPRTITS